MQVINLRQGSDEWFKHRAKYRNASDAPAMFGCSKHLSRDALLQQYATGVSPEFSKWVQEHILDRGHRFEALTRPYAEKIIGEDLSPIIGVDDSETYSASFDGITFAQDVLWENKSINEALRNVETAEELPEMYRVQMEHQMLVSGASRVLFTAAGYDDNDAQTEFVWFWYKGDTKLRDQIIERWEQFEQEVKVWTPPESTPEVIAANPVSQLPMPVVTATGELTQSNIDQITPRFDKYLAEVNTELTNDQHFADATEHAKACRAMAKKLDALCEQLVSGMSSVNDAVQTMRAYHKQFNSKGLQLEKLVKTERERIKAAAIMAAKTALADHVAELDMDLPKPSGQVITLGIQQPDYAAAIKNVRKLESMHSRINDTLAAAKAEANTRAADYKAKLTYIIEAIDGHEHLFPNLQELVSKDIDHIKLHVTSQIDAEKARQEKIAQDAKEKAEREAAAKLEAEQEAEAERLEEQRRAQEAAEDFNEKSPLPNSLQDQAPAPAKPTGVAVVSGRSKTSAAKKIEVPAALDEIYVVVTERDTVEPEANSVPAIMETDASKATIEMARKRVAAFGGRYGKTRIAKLVFIDEAEQREAS